ncbi:NAD-P-binding protein [Dentipellis sp. KUC8613]|nr:NAD-P-binding protein [Dentipellis sp. KUC8613]
MGNVLTAVIQMWPPQPRWGVDDIPDLTGQVMVVTGGASGVGKETMKALLIHGAKVYIATRSEVKAKAAIEQLQAETGKEALSLHLDLADLPSVRKAAEEFLSKEPELHVLFNNAGVMSSPMDKITAQGYDLQFGTNVIGPYLFTNLLLPALFAATASGKHGKARVVTVSSSANYLINGIDYDTIRDGKRRRSHADPDMLYCQSKFANVLVVRELARRYGDKIVSTSLNPGNLESDLHRYLKGFRKFVIGRILYPTPMGALTQLWAGTAPETADYNGRFLIPWARLGKANSATDDPETAQKLWDWLEGEVKGI